jgi:hypothetical protein
MSTLSIYPNKIMHQSIATPELTQQVKASTAKQY